MAPAKKKSTNGKITIPKVVRQTARLIISGREPGMLMHQLGKLKRQEITGQIVTQDSKTGEINVEIPPPLKIRPPRDPKKEYDNCQYRTVTGDLGVPALAFKGAMRTMAKYFDNVDGTDIGRGVYIRGESNLDGGQDIIPFKKHAKPKLHEADVVLNGRTKDIRYRALIETWELELLLECNPIIIEVEQAINLLEHAGFNVGVGDWRLDSKNGIHGGFNIKKSELITVGKTQVN